MCPGQIWLVTGKRCPVDRVPDRSNDQRGRQSQKIFLGQFSSFFRILLVDVSDVFFVQRGGGEGGVQGARKGRVSFFVLLFLLKIRGGGSPTSLFLFVQGKGTNMEFVNALRAV